MSVRAFHLKNANDGFGISVFYLDSGSIAALHGDGVLVAYPDSHRLHIMILPPPLFSANLVQSSMYALQKAFVLYGRSMKGIQHRARAVTPRMPSTPLQLAEKKGVAKGVLV